MLLFYVLYIFFYNSNHLRSSLHFYWILILSESLRTLLLFGMCYFLLMVACSLACFIILDCELNLGRALSGNPGGMDLKQSCLFFCQMKSSISTVLGNLYTVLGKFLVFCIPGSQIVALSYYKPHLWTGLGFRILRGAFSTQWPQRVDKVSHCLLIWVHTFVWGSFSSRMQMFS